MSDAATSTTTTTTTSTTGNSTSQRYKPPALPDGTTPGAVQPVVHAAGGIISRGLSFLRVLTPASSASSASASATASTSSSPTKKTSSMSSSATCPFPSMDNTSSPSSDGSGWGSAHGSSKHSSGGTSHHAKSIGSGGADKSSSSSTASNSHTGPRAMSLAATHKNGRKRKGSLRKVILNRGALRERRESKSGLSIDIKQSLALGLAPAANVVSGAAEKGTITGQEEVISPESPEQPPILGGRGSRFPLGGGSYGLGIAGQGKAGSGGSTMSGRISPGSGMRLPPGAIAAAQIGNPLSSGGLLSPGIDSTTDEEDSPLQLRPRHATVKSPLSFSSPTSGAPRASVMAAADWDYSETEWWGWVVLISTWFVFVIGMGSCFGVWGWAWDVGTTPYAPPELEDDPTLPIVGYYPALIILSGVMAWLWVLVAWVGMKYFRHAKVTGD